MKHVPGSPEREWHSIERQWYDEDFEHALLDYDTDTEWLSDISGVEFDESKISYANMLVTRGSIHLGRDTDPETFSTVMLARRQFFEDVLGWGDPEHPLSNTYRNSEARCRTLIPLATFVETQRELRTSGLENSKIILGNSDSLSISAELVRDRFEGMTSLGFDPVKIFNQTPRIMRYTNETIREKVDWMSGKGFDARKVVHGHGGILTRSLESIEKKIEEFNARGFDFVKLTNFCPAMITADIQTVEEKRDHLSSYGIDAAKSINRFPPLILMKSETIDAKFRCLEQLGLDAAHVANRQPQLLGMNVETLHKKMLLVTAIARYANAQIDVIHMVNTQPALLCFSPKNLRATMRIYAGDSGRDAMSTLTSSKLQNLLCLPIDSLMVAAAMRRFDGGQVEVRDVVTMRDNIKQSSQRRGSSLEILRDTEKRQALGPRAVRAYLDYKPLKPAEYGSDDELTIVANQYQFV